MVNKKSKKKHIVIIDKPPKPRRINFIGENKISTYTNRKGNQTTRKIVSVRPFKNNVGQLWIHFRFFKKGLISSIDVWGFSFNHDLSNLEEYKKAKVEAFKSAFAKIPFSPEKFEIIDERYVYYESVEQTKNIKQLAVIEARN